MAASLSIKFLGTSSQPNGTRNYSSLLVRHNGKASIMVDCGEGTQRQIIHKHIGAGDRLSDLRCVLITHLHADHVLGLVPLLTSLMGPSASASVSDTAPRVEIFGPLGLRALLRAQLTLCYTSLTGKYVVHELLWPGQRPTSNQEASAALAKPELESDIDLPGATHGPLRVIPELPLHPSELPGRDIFLDESSKAWHDITTVDNLSISAAPILHRCPTLGFVLREADSASPLPHDTFKRLDENATLLKEQGVNNPRSLAGKLVKEREVVELPDGTRLEPPPLDIKGRKLCICGDTRDASGGLPDGEGLVALAQDADLLVHEATNAAIHQEISGAKKADDLIEIQQKAASRGHSTPQVAGTFAGRIKAGNLVLNHFSTRYPAPPAWLIQEAETGQSHTRAKATARGGSQTSPFYRQLATMQSFAMQATIAWHASMPQDSPGDAQWRTRQAQAAWDGLVVEVERPLTGKQQHALKNRETPKDAPQSSSRASQSHEAAQASSWAPRGGRDTQPGFNAKSPVWKANDPNRPKRIKGVKGLHQIHLLDMQAQLQNEQRAAAARGTSGMSTTGSTSSRALDGFDSDLSTSSSGSLGRISRKRRPSLQGSSSLVPSTPPSEEGSRPSPPLDRSQKEARHLERESESDVQSEATTTTSSDRSVKPREAETETSDAKALQDQKVEPQNANHTGKQEDSSATSDSHNVAI
ncbi:unnamed protein product [Parajaminaea phylloscopi]